MIPSTKVLFDSALSKRLAGNWQSAVEIYEEAFRQALLARDAVDLMEAVLAIGHAYREGGTVDAAIEHYELAVEVAQLQGNPRIAGRALNGLGIVNHMFLADVAQAESLYLQARELSAAAGDQLGVGAIDQNLGTLSTIRGARSDAVKHYESALASFEQVGNEGGLAGILNNLGMLHLDLEDFSEAEGCLDRALEVSRKLGDLVTESIVHTNRVELFLAMGDQEQARTSCDEAFEMASRLGENRIKGEALKFYGMIYRETGKPHLAEIHLRQAIALAAKYSDPLNEAEAQRELALVYRAQNKNREALSALNRAHTLFAALQATRKQADVTARLAKLEDDFLALVRMWGESIEAKDRYTRGHCQRVADYACRIAERAGIPERDMVWFRMGAFLHDVGKTDIPGEILNKPGRLSEDERTIIEQHTVLGDEMLAPIPFPWDIRPMVRSHHERWDGRGYPDGLAGEEIHPTARILRLADIFDALTTTRSYRQPLTAEQALQIMRDDHGSFDPELFAVFEELFPEFAVMVGGVQSAHDDAPPAAAAQA